jgi:hypothetical protein
VRAYEIRIKELLEATGRSESLDLAPAKAGGDEAALLENRSQNRMAALLV